MTGIAGKSAEADGASLTPPPGAIVQSATIAFRVVYIVTLLLGVLWLGSNFRVISSDNQAVVMRFGRIIRIQRSGLLLAWPRPIENVLLLPGPDRQITRHVGPLPAVPGIEDVSLTAGGSTLPADATPYLTGDGRVVLLDATLIYRITDPAAYVLAREHIAPAIDRIFRASAVQVAAGQNLNAFLVAQAISGEQSAQSIDALRAAVREGLLQRVNARLKALQGNGDGLGVEVSRIDLTAWLPPKAKLAFDSVLTAAQKADQDIATASTAAELRRQGAQREADRLGREAQAYAIELKTNASVQTTNIGAIERMAPSVRAGLEQQIFRNQIGPLLNKAGTVLAVDPKGGRHLLMNGSANAIAPKP